MSMILPSYDQVTALLPNTQLQLLYDEYENPPAYSSPISCIDIPQSRFPHWSQMTIELDTPQSQKNPEIFIQPNSTDKYVYHSSDLITGNVTLAPKKDGIVSQVYICLSGEARFKGTVIPLNVRKFVVHLENENSQNKLEVKKGRMYKFMFSIQVPDYLDDGCEGPLIPTITCLDENIKVSYYISACIQLESFNIEQWFPSEIVLIPPNDTHQSMETLSLKERNHLDRLELSIQKSLFYNPFRSQPTKNMPEIVLDVYLTKAVIFTPTPNSAPCVIGLVLEIKPPADISLGSQLEVPTITSIETELYAITQVKTSEDVPSVKHLTRLSIEQHPIIAPLWKTASHDKSRFCELGIPLSLRKKSNRIPNIESDILQRSHQAQIIIDFHKFGRHSINVPAFVLGDQKQLK